MVFPGSEMVYPVSRMVYTVIRNGIYRDQEWYAPENKGNNSGY